MVEPFIARRHCGEEVTPSITLERILAPYGVVLYQSR